MMTQPNLDYLLQITAPLVERPSGGSGSHGLDRPGFGDHLAQASGSARSSGSHSDLRERPAPSGPLERNSRHSDSATIDHESSNAELSAEEYGACAEPAQAGACGGDESGSSESETDVSDSSLAVSTSDADSAEESAAQNESESEAEGETENHTDTAVNTSNTAGQLDAAANPLQVALTDVVDDAVQLETGKETEISSGSQSASQRQQGLPPSAGENSPGVATDFPGDLQKIDANAQSVQPAHASTLAISAETQIAAADTGQLNEGQPAAKAVDKASRKSAARHDSGHANDAAHDHSPAHNVGNAQPNNNDAVNNQRRTADKIKSTVDSRRRPNEKSESPVAHRPESIGSVNQAAANALVSDVRVDSMAASTKIAGDESVAKPGNTSAAKSDVLLHPLARTNRGQGVTGRAGRSDSADSLPRVDTTRFVGRVAKAIQTANERGGALQLRLSPPELGSLRLQLTVQDGVMTASLEAESPAARQLLLDHLPSLRDRLAEQNIRIDRFDVDVRHEDSGGQPDPRGSQHEQRQQQFQQSTTRREANGVPIGDGAAVDNTVIHARITNNGLNVLA
jgi:flagellar hook-length control protein FliK